MSAQLPAVNQPSFSRNLAGGYEGDDVRALQRFLANRNTGPMAQKLAAVGATGYFGQLTRKALAEFQDSVGIQPSVGYFGLKTRAYVNTLNNPE